MNKNFLSFLAILITAILSSIQVMAVNNPHSIAISPNYLDAATNGQPIKNPNLPDNKPSLKAVDKPTGLTIPTAPPPPPIAITSLNAVTDKPVIESAAVKQSEQAVVKAQEEKDLAEKKERAKLVNELMDIDYNVKVPPKQLYEHGKDNNHLPPVYFKSYYLSLAFKAAEHDNVNELNAALAKNNFLNGQNKDGDTVLMYAIQYQSLNVARLLLAKGAFVNAINHRKRTALHYAATLGDITAIKLLLTMGADPSLRDDRNMTAFEYAEANKHHDAYVLLSKFKG